MAQHAATQVDRWHGLPGLPAPADGATDSLVRLAALPRLGDGWDEHVLVERRTHPLDDVVVERRVGLELVADGTKRRLLAPFRLAGCGIASVGGSQQIYSLNCPTHTNACRLLMVIY